MVYEVNPYGDENLYLDNMGMIRTYAQSLTDVVRNIGTPDTKLKFFKLINVIELEGNFHSDDYNIMRETEELIDKYSDSDKVLIISAFNEDKQPKFRTRVAIDFLKEKIVSATHRYKSMMAVGKISERENFTFKFSIADVEPIIIDLEKLTKETEIITSHIINNIKATDIYSILTKSLVGLNPSDTYSIIDIRSSAVIALCKIGKLHPYFIDRTMKFDESFINEILEGKHPHLSLLAIYDNPVGRVKYLTLTRNNGYKNSEGLDESHISYSNIYQRLNVEEHLNLHYNEIVEEVLTHYYERIKEMFKFVQHKSTISADPFK